MTELQLRATVVEAAAAWLGFKESDKSHRKIIDVYNSHKPRARAYKVKYTDAWCAAFVSAVAISCGLTDIMPTECSCSKMIQLYKAQGRWEESDEYVPSAGDIVMYDWDDDSKGDNKGAPDHVGIVTHVDSGWIEVIEGNYNNAVAYHDLQIGGKYIRGYCLPDYASKADKERYGKEITITLHQLSRGCCGEEVRAMQILLMAGGYDVGKYGADGEFGADTEKAVRAFQREHDLDVDGIAGKDTVTALLTRQ